MYKVINNIVINKSSLQLQEMRSYKYRIATFTCKLIIKIEDADRIVVGKYIFFTAWNQGILIPCSIQYT